MGEGRPLRAEHLCRVAGLMESSADEVNKAVRTQLMAAAAVGTGVETVELLAAAAGNIKLSSMLLWQESIHAIHGQTGRLSCTQKQQ